MQDHLDNPAGRLHAILSVLKGANQNSPLHKIWAAVLKVSEYDHAELLRELALVLALPHDAKRALDRLDPGDVDHGLLSKWHPPVAQALSNSVIMQKQLCEVIELLDGETLLSLAVCSDALHRHCPEPTASSADREEVARLLNDLQRAVSEAGLDAELQDFLEALTIAMTKATNDYEVRGIAALDDAFDFAVGRLHRLGHLSARVADEHPKVWQRVVELMAKLTIVVSAIGSPFQLENTIHAALEGPAKASPVVVVQETCPSTSTVP